MKALVFDRELNYSECEPIPAPSEGEALIRILMAGICNTDIEITKGYKGFKGILGHEFVGIVTEESILNSFKDYFSTVLIAKKL